MVNTCAVLRDALLIVGGMLAGGLGVAAVARWQITRSLAKSRAAERRAVAAERLAEIGAMTGGLAHEIKNPLSTIGLNAQLLAEGIDELPTDAPIDASTKQRLLRRLGSLRREAERLRGILQDFLSYAGELRLDAKPDDLNRLVEDLVDFFSPQAERQGVRIRTELAPGGVIASIDEPLLKQAVLNLMLNGVQALVGRPSGELMIRTVSTLGLDKRPQAELHVIDTGPGIPDEVLKNIYKPYFTTKAGGSGLGLPTTRRIVEAHHGRLEVHTEIGKGTDFTIVLPGENGVGTESGDLAAV